METLQNEIDEYNSNDEEDLFGYGDMLEIRRIQLINKAEKWFLGDENNVLNFPKIKP
jgi:hypothetical protein